MRIFTCLLLMTVTFFFRSYAEELVEPYNSIQVLPMDQHGWFLNGRQLEACIREKPCTVVIEIGSWLGASTRFLAQQLGDQGKVYAVDTWLGSPTEKLHMKDKRLPYLYQSFLSNVIHAGLTHKIVPVRMSSLEASKALNIMADLIYIDASHEEMAVYEDILAWKPHLKQEGILCGDDWSWESVRKGVERAARQLNLRILPDGNFWRLY